eukprot:jgi/Mesvir1/20526/Mv25339-RA.1
MTSSTGNASRLSRGLLALVLALHACHEMHSALCAAGAMAVKRNAGPPEEIPLVANNCRDTAGLSGHKVRSRSVWRELNHVELTTLRPGGQLKSLTFMNVEAASSSNSSASEILDRIELVVSGKSRRKASSLSPDVATTTAITSDPLSSPAVKLHFRRTKLHDAARDASLEPSSTDDVNVEQAMKAVSLRLHPAYAKHVPSSSRANSNYDTRPPPLVIATGYADVALEAGFKSAEHFVGAPVELDICVMSGDAHEELSLLSVSMTALPLFSDEKTILSGASQTLPATWQSIRKIEAMPSTDHVNCFNASHAPDRAGYWEYRVEASGVGFIAGEFERTARITAHVGDLPLGHILSASMKMTIEEGVDYAAIFLSGLYICRTPQALRVVAYGELMGTDAQGVMGPVAFARHIAEVRPVAGEDGRWETTLMLHADWLAREQRFQAPYALRNVTLRSVDLGYLRLNAMGEGSLLPIDMADVTTRRMRARALLFQRAIPITDEMRYGRKPARKNSSHGRRLLTSTGHRVILVHGYCSSDVWGHVAYQFDNAVKYLDLQKNVRHDTFARGILKFGEDFDSYTIIAHGQGGAAALHLYTYYWSGLDEADPSARLIQSVGTPYQGTPLAHFALAGLGSVFGKGCGQNDDLYYDGASAWLKGIPAAARDKVYYYTTSEAADACDALTDASLADAQDGVMEQAKGQLDGGHNMGHKTGWCHTLNMAEPPQTWDSARNAEMNRFAQAPATDALAIPLTPVYGVGSTLTVTGTTINAVDRYTDTCGTSATNGRDVLYSYRPKIGQRVTIEVGAYTATAPLSKIWSTDPLFSQCIDTPVDLDSGSGVRLQNVALTAGADYYIAVDGYAGGANYSLAITVTAQDGDTTDNPIVIPTLDYVGASASITANLSRYTSSYEIQCGMSVPAGPDVVFTYVPAYTQTVRFDTCTSEFDTVLEIKRADGTGEPWCSDDADPPETPLDECFNSTGSRVPGAALAAGVTYRILVKGYYEDSTGWFALTLTVTSQPTGPVETPAVRKSVVISPLAQVGDTYTVTTNTSGPVEHSWDFSCGVYTQDVWTQLRSPDKLYTYTPNVPQLLGIDACTAAFTAVVFIWRVDGAAMVTDSNTCSCRHNGTLVAGVQYYIMVKDRCASYYLSCVLYYKIHQGEGLLHRLDATAQPAAFTLLLTALPRDGDLLSSVAIVIPPLASVGNRTQVSGSTLGYSDDSSISCVTNQNTAPSPAIVYSYVPGVSQLVDVSACVASFPAVVEMWRADAVSMPENAGRACACHLLSAVLSAGVSYRIEVRGFNASGYGSFNLTLEVKPWSKCSCALVVAGVLAH